MTESDKLLLAREIKGLRMTALARGAFILLTFGGMILGSQSGLETRLVGALSVCLFFLTVFFFVLLGRPSGQAPERTRLIGILGTLADVLTLWAIPFIWYRSIGTGDLPPAFLAKGGLLMFCILINIINCFALRPLYPFIITLGVVCLNISLLTFIVVDPRTEFTETLAPALMDSAFNPPFFIGNNLGASFFAGIFLTLLTRLMRITILRAVTLEKSNVMMGRYFSPNVVEKLNEADEDFFRPGGEMREVAVLFSDIRGFTSLSEKMSPDNVLELLQEYHEVMTGAIFACGGTLDKYIGDGIMATFGTPYPGDNDALNALRAGVAMKQALAVLNTRREARGEPALKQGIGIHYGEAIVGNVGAKDRLEYTVIGDTVNQASRLESSCKELGEDFLISRALLERLGAARENFIIRALGEIQVKGKTDSISVFAVDGEATQYQTT